eukprot:5961397-Amphidinium_carterae.1
MPEEWGERPLQHPPQSESERVTALEWMYAIAEMAKGWVPNFTPFRVRGLAFDGVAGNGNSEAEAS